MKDMKDIKNIENNLQIIDLEKKSQDYFFDTDFAQIADVKEVDELEESIEFDELKESIKFDDNSQLKVALRNLANQSASAIAESKSPHLVFDNKLILRDSGSQSASAIVDNQLALSVNQPISSEHYDNFMLSEVLTLVQHPLCSFHKINNFKYSLKQVFERDNVVDNFIHCLLQDYSLKKLKAGFFLLHGAPVDTFSRKFQEKPCFAKSIENHVANLQNPNVDSNATFSHVIRESTDLQIVSVSTYSEIAREFKEVMDSNAVSVHEKFGMVMGLLNYSDLKWKLQTSQLYSIVVADPTLSTEKSLTNPILNEWFTDNSAGILVLLGVLIPFDPTIHSEAMSHIYQTSWDEVHQLYSATSTFQAVAASGFAAKFFVPFVKGSYKMSKTTILYGIILRFI